MLENSDATLDVPSVMLSKSVEAGSSVLGRSVEPARLGGGSRRVRIDRVEIDPLSMDEVTKRIQEVVQATASRGLHVITPNAQYVQLARCDSEFASLISGADLSVADGLPLVWASRMLGSPIPERVNGTDLMMRLCKEAAGAGNTVYLLGGRPGAAELAVQRLQALYPGLASAGVDCPPYGFLEDPKEMMVLDRKIMLAKPDLLFVGLGAPNQDYWIKQHLHLPVKVMVGVGGSFELIAGIQRRAPVLFQRFGCEWLWRLFREPRRLWKRYAIGNTVFVYLVLRQWLRGCST